MLTNILCISVYQPWIPQDTWNAVYTKKSNHCYSSISLRMILSDPQSEARTKSQESKAKSQAELFSGFQT